MEDEAESVMAPYRPSDTDGARGLRSALIRRDWRHAKMSRIVLLIFSGKATVLKKMASITLKKTLIMTKKKVTNRDCCPLLIGVALINSSQSYLEKASVLLPIHKYCCK